MSDAIEMSPQQIKEMCRWEYAKDDMAIKPRLWNLQTCPSSTGRYMFLLNTRPIIAIDTFNGNKSEFAINVYTKTNCAEIDQKLIFYPSSDCFAYLIQNVIIRPGEWTAIIRHAEFNYSLGSVELSQPAPLHDETFTYAYLSAPNISNDGTLAVIVRNQLRGSKMKNNLCRLYKFRGGKWIYNKCINLGFFNYEGPAGIEYFHYPKLESNFLYSFPHCSTRRFLEILKDHSKLSQINIDTGEQIIIKTKNDLHLFEFNEQTLRHTAPLGHWKYKWNGDILYLCWAIKRGFVNHLDPPNSNLMHYMATFNIKTLFWQPIQIPSFTPELHYIPLQFQMTDDNILILSDFNKEASNTEMKSVHIFYVSMPFGNPKTLARLSQLTAFLTYPRFKNIYIQC